MRLFFFFSFLCCIQFLIRRPINENQQRLEDSYFIIFHVLTGQREKWTRMILKCFLLFFVCLSDCFPSRSSSTEVISCASSCVIALFCFYNASLFLPGIPSCSYCNSVDFMWFIIVFYSYEFKIRSLVMLNDMNTLLFQYDHKHQDCQEFL